MRFVEFIALEATRVKDKVDVDLGNLFSEPKSNGQVAPQTKPSHKVQPKVASRSKTQARMANATMSPDAVNQLSQMEFDPTDLDLNNEISDDEAKHNADYDEDTFLQHLTNQNRDEPKTPETLPSIISKAMTSTGKGVNVMDPNDIDWHQVKNLPGYLSTPIRAMGRKVFAPFTSTPIEDIQVLASIGGGPNTDQEMDTMSRWISSHGKRDSAAELEFTKHIKGYQADVVIYNAEGFTFMYVRDFAGNYIYGWPEKDSKKITHNPNLPRLN